MWNTPLYQTNKLTVELRDIVDNGDNSVDIWDFEYPSYYTGNEKKVFEKKVIDHFYFRQIGQETVGRFLHYFRSRIIEIMPYYIQLYKSVEIMNGIEDPFGNIDITETYEEEHSGSVEGESSANSNLTTTNKITTNTTSGSTKNETREITEEKQHKFSDTPQGTISNINSHLTNASIDSNTNGDTLTATDSSSADGEETTTGNNTGTASETNMSTTSGIVKHTLKKKGNQGVNTYAHDMIEFRQALIDVDMMIINNLQDLFLQVY